jgi:hypothetical protein
MRGLEMMGQRMKTDEVDGVALTMFASLARWRGAKPTRKVMWIFWWKWRQCYSTPMNWSFLTPI